MTQTTSQTAQFRMLTAPGFGYRGERVILKYANSAKEIMAAKKAYSRGAVAQESLSGSFDRTDKYVSETQTRQEIVSGLVRNLKVS